jgi:DNA-binding SARP family transcriptional activator/predicted ATPase/Tfp pilus assembly protein PilF
MARLTLHLLGSFQASLDEQPITGFRSDKTRALLAYLVTEANRSHRRESLAALLWGGSSEKAARLSLRVSLSNLHKILSPIAHYENDPEGSADDAPCLTIARESVRMNLPCGDCWIDVVEFDTLLAKSDAHRHEEITRCPACIQRLMRAVELYQGDFLAGLVLPDSPDFDEWRLLHQEMRHHRALAAFETLASHFAGLGQYEHAERLARQQIALEPWREEAHRQLMLVLALSGDRSGAIAQYATCRQILLDELGVEPAEETVALYEQICQGETGYTWAQESKPSPLREFLPTQHHNLPLQVTPFIGREAELAQLVQRIVDPAYRLVSLVGVGGVGKTRLALTAAEQALSHFPHGVWFVPLVAVADYGLNTRTTPAQMAPDEQQEASLAHGVLTTAIADALGLTFSGKDEPQRQLLDYLYDREMLIVLDGFERLMGASRLLLNILPNAPLVTILITSRQRLNLRAEYAIMVGGMPIPETDRDPLAKTYGSIQLFAERADRTPAGFDLDDAHLPDVIQVCRLVEGLPLGIELAAGLVGQMMVPDIAQNIRHGLDVLATSMEDVPERHRSMRAVFEGSWRLLSHSEQIALAQLSVFRGRFDREAVLALPNISAQNLTALVDQSLLRQFEPGRYEMHEFLRQFAAEKLDMFGEAGTVDLHELRDRHASFYLGIVEREEIALRGRQPQQAAVTMRKEMENIRQAWRWSVEQVKIEALQQGLIGLSRYFRLTGLFQEAEQAFGTAADRLRECVQTARRPGRAMQVLLGRLYAEQARFLSHQGLYDRAIMAARMAIDLAQTTYEVSLEALSYHQWGRALLDRGEYRMARPQLERALTLAWAIELRQVQTDSLRDLGLLSIAMGDYLRAKAYWEQALRVHQESSDRQGEGATLTNLGIVSTILGDYARARNHLENALRILREIGDRHDECVTLYQLGQLYHQQEENDTAQQYCQQALHIVQDFDDPRLRGQVLTGLGHILVELQDLAGAATAYQQALDLQSTLGQPQLAAEPLAGLAHISLAREDLYLAQSQAVEVLSLLEHGALDHARDPCRIFWICYRVLRASQDPRAQKILIAAYNLLQERATKIEDEALRHSYLENVACHQTLANEFGQAA